MYGRRNPVLRHFGADDLAAEGTLRAVEERRSRGEVVRPLETVVQRPTPEFNSYFEFDSPVQSGLPPSALDPMVEEANTHAWRQRADADSAVSGGSSPQPYYASPVGSEQELYGGYTQERPRRSGDVGSPDSGVLPGRAAGIPSTITPRNMHDMRNSIQQPPFRSGVPASGPVQPSGVTAQTAGSRGRRGSSSPDRSRSPSASPQPSSESMERQRRPSASSITSPGAGGAPEQPRRPAATGSTATTPRRSLGAKISGREVAAASSSTPRGGAAGRRPSAPASSGTAARGAAGRNSGTGAAAAPPPARVPAWAPAAGIADMRLEDEDEATRVALMLNDPGLHRNGDGGKRRGGGRDRERLDSDPTQSASPGAEPQVLPQASPSPRPPLSGRSPSPSPGYGGSVPEGRRPSDVSQQFYGRYRLRKHREMQGVPDYRFSQPRSYGVHAPVQQRYFSFDEAHPAVAEQHYARSPTQDMELEKERRKMQQVSSRAAQLESRRRFDSPRGMSSSALPSARQLEDDVERLGRVREAGRARLRELEDEGETLRQATRQVQRRALDVISRSEQMSMASRSVSPGASPGPARSRSRSPAHGGYYSGRAGASYNRGTFGLPPPPPQSYSARGSYYGSSPRLSPVGYRPVSASPESVYSPVSAREGGALYGAGGYYGSPAAALPMLQRHQVHQQQYKANGGSKGGNLRPLSAPPRSQGGAGGGGGGGGTAYGSDEAADVLGILNGVERLPQHPQLPLGAAGSQSNDTGAEASRSDPDFVGRARSVASSRQDLGLLGPDEQRTAIGAYDRARYEEYQRQVDLEMQRRAVEGGYDSDLDRDDAADLLVEDREKLAAEEEARRLAEEAEREHRDSWMEEYRQRLGPEDGYLPHHRSAGGEGDRDVAGRGGSRGVAAQQSVLSDAEEQLLREAFVPVVSPELILSPEGGGGGGYTSEGPDGSHLQRRTRRCLFFKSTIPEPFTFEERQKSRPKPISKVKLDQDLAIRRAEEEEALRRHFRAKPVPVAVVEPRYERMLLEAEAKRQLTHDQRLEDMARLMEQPFTFYYRDRQQQEEREALARAAKDPNRFQVAFKARGVPQSVREERFRVMMLELEAQRESSRRRVEDARRGARERAAQEAALRREAADRSYQERLRAVDPATHPHPPKPLGLVPDFNSLHRHNEVAMARARANLRRMVTVPQEFALNGSTPDEQTARARKAQERRQRIILDMQLDAELLPEARWPYKSPRGRVRRTPHPAYLVEWMTNQSPGNRAAHARKSSTAAAATNGAYMTRAEREEVARRTSEKLRAEALKRADRLLKAAQVRRQQEASAAGRGGGGRDFGLESDAAATASHGVESGDVAAVESARGGAVRRRATVSGRRDNPEVYVEARHAQVERQVREVVEETLLEQGIDAYRYVEGIGGATGEGGRVGDRRQHVKP